MSWDRSRLGKNVSSSPLNSARGRISEGKLKDGRPFIYNPDPQAGDATLTVGVIGKKQSASFDAEVAKYSGRAHLDLEKASPAATKVKY